MNITVVNKFKETNYIYCGRGTALGNPFRMRNESDRNTVCEQYEDWFYERIDEANFLDYINNYGVILNPQMSQLRSIFEAALEEDINLGCCCAPKRCHCDTIKSFLDYKLEELDK